MHDAVQDPRTNERRLLWPLTSLIATHRTGQAHHRDRYTRFNPRTADGVHLSEALDRGRRPDCADHAAARRRDAVRLCQPPAVQPDELVEHQHPAAGKATVRSSTANYLVDQFYANVDVAGELKSQLPPALQSLAAPAAGAIRSAAVRGVDAALTRPQVQDLWRKANYAANQSFVKIVKGRQRRGEHQ